jgi:hypothetical protein
VVEVVRVLLGNAPFLKSATGHATIISVTPGQITFQVEKNPPPALEWDTYERLVTEDWDRLLANPDTDESTIQRPRGSGRHPDQALKPPHPGQNPPP